MSGPASGSRPRRPSAGLLLYRLRGGALQVLLVHPGGPFWAKRDAGAWTIPKGELEEGEPPLAAARRELAEETGLRPEGPFIELEPVTQKAGKRVFAWACEVGPDVDPQPLPSNTFTLEWPPRSGRYQTFPEIDRAAFFDLPVARSKINPAQAALLDQLER